MFKKALFVSSIILSTLLFTGCVERGYILTTTPSTQTVTAEMSSDLKDSSKPTKESLKKMEHAVKKAHKKRPTKKAISHKRKRKHQIHKIPKKVEEKKILNEIKAQETAEKQVQLEQKNLEEEAKRLEKQKVQKEAKALKVKEAQEKKTQEREAEKAKEIETLKAENRAKEAKALQEKMALEKAAQEVEKQKAEKEAKQQKILAEKEAEEAKKRKQEKIDALKEKEKKLQKEKASKKERLKEIQKETKAEEKPKKSTKSISTRPLHFSRIKKIYQKFGTSEVHGHVIYLDHAGQEVHLSQAKIYLLPVSAKANHWYQNYYLKNRGGNLSTVSVNFLNDTTLNLDKNFNFFGVPAGNYYIIIEAHSPTTLKKIYIAKKITVGKYKKVMAVFSKKL
jgi:myosin heavy subunit